MWKGGEKMANKRTKARKIPKVLQAIIQEARVYVENGVVVRRDWTGDTYPRYVKKGGIQVKATKSR